MSLGDMRCSRCKELLPDDFVWAVDMDGEPVCDKCVEEAFVVEADDENE